MKTNLGNIGRANSERKLVMVASTCNPNTWEMENRLGFRVRLSYKMSLRSTWTESSFQPKNGKKKRGGKKEKVNPRLAGGVAY